MSTLALGTLQIEAFRGLRGVELLNPGRFNILVGPNNSGKTSALEAIAYFCRPADPVHWLYVASLRSIGGIPRSTLDLALQPFSRREGLPQLYETYRVAVGAESSSHHVVEAEVICKTSEKVMDASTSPPLMFSLSPRTRPFGDFQWNVRRELGHDDRFGYQLEIPGGSNVPLEPYDASCVVPVSAVFGLGHLIERVLIDQWSAAVLDQYQGDVVRAVSVFDPLIQSIDVTVDSGGQALLHFTHEALGVCPQSMFGDGLKRAFAYALALVQARGGVLLIDEVEMALHVSALERVYGWLREMCERLNVQLFVTTHSLEAVEALLGATPSEDTVCYQLGGPGRAVRRWQGALLGRVVRRRGLDVR